VTVWRKTKNTLPDEFSAILRNPDVPLGEAERLALKALRAWMSSEGTRLPSGVATAAVLPLDQFAWLSGATGDTTTASSTYAPVRAGTASRSTQWRNDVRLIDLEPRETIDADIVVGGQLVHDGNRHGMGLSFLCPHCRQVRLGVFYKNPIDGRVPSDDGLLWTRSGDTFDTLTLSPSIDASKHGHWHGVITNGEVT
jgi:hypothetical protein